MKKRNKIAIDLFSKKYHKRVVKPKREKEVLKEGKNNLIYPSTNYLNNFS